MVWLVWSNSNSSTPSNSSNKFTSSVSKLGTPIPILATIYLFFLISGFGTRNFKKKKKNSIHYQQPKKKTIKKGSQLQYQHKTIRVLRTQIFQHNTIVLKLQTNTFYFYNMQKKHLELIWNSWNVWEGSLGARLTLWQLPWRLL